MMGFLQLAGGFILSFGWIFQIIQTIKTKEVKDFNLNTFISMTIGIALMEAYAISLLIKGQATAFFITNTLSLLINVVMMGLILKYRNHSPKTNNHIKNDV